MTPFHKAMDELLEQAKDFFLNESPSWDILEFAASFTRKVVESYDRLLDAADEIVEAHWNEGDVRAAIRSFERVRVEVFKKSALNRDKEGGE